LNSDNGAHAGYSARCHDRQGQVAAGRRRAEELEAEQALAFITRRQEQDPVLEFFDTAPEQDEPLTPAERASVDEAWTQRGDSVSIAELRREFG
jgi:hypothetical protein